MKILVVDDDINALQILELALLEAGYNHFDLAFSASEALEYLENTDAPYDCFLLDIIMPGMNGVDLCQHVRQHPLYAHVPIIMITASQDKDTLTKAIAVGATDYVNKPFDGLELITRLRAAEALMSATKAARRRPRRDTAGSKIATPSALRLSDGFSLDPTAGVVSQADLVCALAETDQFLRSMHLFAVALADVSRLFSALSNLEFRAFINELAGSICSTTHGWQPRMSYIGDGIFIVALFDVGFLSAKEIHKVLKAGLEARLFEAIALYPGEVRLCVYPVHLSEPDEYYRMEVLYRAGRIAKITADYGTTAEYETEVRQQFLGQENKDAGKSYKCKLAKAALKRIVPRRLSPRQQGVRNDSYTLVSGVESKDVGNSLSLHERD